MSRVYCPVLGLGSVTTTRPPPSGSRGACNLVGDVEICKDIAMQGAGDSSQYGVLQRTQEEAPASLISPEEAASGGNEVSVLVG